MQHPMTDEHRLLHEYVARRSQEAFARLTEQYVDLVYSSARRQVRDLHLAEDVTQAVFIVLAQKAATIPADRPLSAWLLKTTAYCAANARRGREHREHYERRAAEMARMTRGNGTSTHAGLSDTGGDAGWDDLSPLLDEGIARLRAKDRDAVLLRFFEKKTLRQVGEAMGISEEAAGKRVARAVDRLRDFFRRRGAAVTGAGLGAMLLAQSTQAAPAGLAGASAASAAVGVATTVGAASATATAASASSAAAVAKGAMLVMAAEKAKVTLVAVAVLLLGVGGGALAVRAVLSSGVSNRPRQVSVATQPAALAPVKQTPGWPVRMPSGRVIEVLGISHDAPSGAGEWWGPDGAPVTPPLVAIPRGPNLPVPRGSRLVQIVVRSAYGPDERLLVGIFSRPGYFNHNHVATPQGAVHRMVQTVPVDAASVTLTLGCGFGAWETQIPYALQPGGPGPQYAGLGAPTIKRITSQGNETVLEGERVPLPSYDSAIPLNQELVLIKTDGTVVAPTNVQRDGTWAQSRFPIPLAEARNALYRVRPFEAVRLEIAARPGEKPNTSLAVVSSRSGGSATTRDASVATTQASTRD